MNSGINPGNLSESQLASFQQQTPTVQRESMKVYAQNLTKNRSIQSMSNMAQEPASLYGDPGIMQAATAEWNAQQDHTVPSVSFDKKREDENERTLILREHSNIELSPSMYQEAAFLATDESREESRKKHMYRNWGDSLRNNTAPSAWQTDSANFSLFPSQRTPSLNAHRGQERFKTPQQYPTYGSSDYTHSPQDYRLPPLPTLTPPVPPYRPQQPGAFGYPEAGQSTQP